MNARPTVVVAGNGMVGYRFVRDLTDRAPGRFRVVVFGEERRAAYDRVHLTRILTRGMRPDDLALASRSWYQRRGIELHLGDPVIDIDRQAAVVRSRAGHTQPYDTLVLATGAEPVVPPIRGADLPGVSVYRSAADLSAIKLSARRSSTVAVLGGGLLGLEAACALADLGLETFVLEGGPHLLARQLDPLSADLVHERIEKRGIRVSVKSRVLSIRHNRSELMVELDGAAPLSVDLVVLATGVRPNDRLARSAGLAVDDLRGGIAVDDHLTTSDARILAIGDCARHAGECYGLVGPGYQMARIAAARVASGGAGTESFAGGDLSCRLDVDGLEVAALGDYAGGGRALVYQDRAVRRTLVLRAGAVVGVRSVGGWPGLAAVERVMAEGRRLTAAESDRFCRTGDPWPSEQTAARACELVCADSAIVCQCARVSCGVLRAEVARGASSVTALGQSTGAGTVCGSCRPLLAQLCGDRAAARVRGRWPMIGVSVAALAACSVFLFMAPWPLSALDDDLVRRLSRFWHNGNGKLMSGFGLVGVAALGLILPLRKRVKRLRRGSMAWFRVFHGLVGALAAAMLVIHTGMQTGANLNRALLYVFLAVVATGGLVGLAAAGVTRSRGGVAALAHRARSWVTWSHWLFLAALPVLLVFHVIAVFYF